MFIVAIREKATLENTQMPVNRGRNEGMSCDSFMLWKLNKCYKEWFIILNLKID